MPPRKAYPTAADGDPKPIPAPLKGLNTRDGHTMLGPDEARALENWLPDTQCCLVRPGFQNYCPISGALSIPTLAAYFGASGQRLIAGANGGLYDLTSPPASTLVAASTYSSSLWQTQSFDGFLFGVNGIDTPWAYNGSSVGATGFTGTGLTLSSLNTVSLIRGGNAGRLWFTQNNSADVWYGPSAGITGALTKFQLSQIAQGGNCAGIGSWSYDGGSGPLEQTVFIMSTGEILIYTGDPATTFQIVGTYAAPAPIGLKPFVKIGGELVILTANGPIPVSYIFRGLGFDLTQLQTWGKIAPSWQADFQACQNNTPWFAHYFNGLVYFNVPLGQNSSKQYVLNTRIPAWTTYTNLPINSIADFQGSLYFGSCVDNNVNVHTGTTDNGSQIICSARQAFGYPFGAGPSWQFTAIRPNIQAAGPIFGQFQIDTDFSTSPLQSAIIPISVSGTGAQWGAPWGSPWASVPMALRQFVGVDGYGQAVAPVAVIYSGADNVQWYSSDIIGIPGTVL